MADDSEAMRFLKEGLDSGGGTSAVGGGSDGSAMDFLREGMAASPAAAAAPGQYGGAGRAVMLGVGAVNDAIPSVLGTPGNLEALYNRYILEPLGIKGDQILPTSHDVKAVTDKWGITGNPRAVPGKGEYPNLEKYGTSAITGAVASLPWAVTGAPIPGLMLSGALGDVSSTAANQLFPDSTVAPLAAGIAGGFAGGGIGNTIDRFLAGRQAAQKLAAAEEGAAATQAVVKEAEMQNPIRLSEARRELEAKTFDTTSNALGVAGQKMEAAQAAKRTVTEQANALRDAMDSHIEGERVAAVAAANKKLEDSVTGANQTVENIAAAHGTARTELEAGDAVQNAVRGWLDKGFPDQIKAQRAIQDSAIPGDTPVPLHSFLGTLKDITTKGGKLEEAEKLLRPQLPDRLKGVFDELLASPGMIRGKPEVTATSPIMDAYGNPVSTVVSPGTPAKPVTWDDTKGLLTALGDARGDYKVVNDLGKDNINRLYAALQESRGMAAADVGAKDVFDSTNAEMNRIYQIAEGPVSKVVSGKVKSAADPAPEDVIKKLGATDLAMLRGEIPDAVNQVAASHLRGEKAWVGLTPEEKAALVPDPAHRTALDDAVAAREEAPAAAKAEIAGLTEQTKQAKTANKDLAAKTIATAREAEKSGISGAKDEASAISEQVKADLTEHLKQNSLLLSTDAKMRGALADQALENVARWKQVANGAPDRLQHTSLMMLLAGEPLGEYALNQLGAHSSSGLGQTVGALSGALAPYVYRGLTRGPAANPLVGGATALGNPLLPDISFTVPGRTSQ